MPIKRDTHMQYRSSLGDFVIVPAPRWHAAPSATTTEEPSDSEAPSKEPLMAEDAGPSAEGLIHA